ncbi:MAG: hypothetical protein AAF639_32055 [Chloroflexota bacterium]
MPINFRAWDPSGPRKPMAPTEFAQVESVESVPPVDTETPSPPSRFVEVRKTSSKLSPTEP